MKTIDTKSLLLGAILSGLFLTLTSSKTSTDKNNLEVYARTSTIDVFNKETNTIYSYYSVGKGKFSEKPDNIYKISADGSSLTNN